MVRFGAKRFAPIVCGVCNIWAGRIYFPPLVEARSQKGIDSQLITPTVCLESRHLRTYLSTMEILLEKQLKEALAERKSVMQEFLRLKAELARTQQRNDDLRSENRALREALRAAEHEVTNLFAYATQVGDEAS